ncbi:MAG TPA: hypothetical protein VMN58_06790 [Acidimicrobiales bacterium]|nr:hypothetical protein [Acidimicrobiales bacterium]
MLKLKTEPVSTTQRLAVIGLLRRARAAGQNDGMGADALRAVYARAVEDPRFAHVLQGDPEAAGRSMGLAAADLAELVGAIRYGQHGAEEGRQMAQVEYAAFAHERGAPWPFTSVPDDELATFAELAETVARSTLISIALGLPANDDLLASQLSWGQALLAECTKRANKGNHVNLAVADALVATRNLVNACQRSRNQPPHSGETNPRI